MTLGGWIFLAILALVVGFAVVTYNRLGLRQRSQAAWSDIDVQLKRRTDLVPNLVETVKGYAAHERTTLDQVIRARGAALGVVLILAGGALFAGRGGFDGAGWPVGVGVVASGLIVFGIGQAMPRRTWRGARLLVHVRGFREFLERAEKDRLERLPADTLHRWLPWAVALGVSQQWIRRFRGLRVDAPSWYRRRRDVLVPPVSAR